MVPAVDVDHATTTAFAAEVYRCDTLSHTLSSGPPTSVLEHEQLGFGSDQGLENQSTVSGHAVLTIVVANWSFSTCLWPPIIPCRPRCPMP